MLARVRTWTVAALMSLVVAGANLAVAPSGHADDAERRTRTTIYASDGTPVDVWVFRPAGLGAYDRTPVIAGFRLAGNDALDPDPIGTPDSQADTSDGYTRVKATAAGVGASGGCADWGGPGDRLVVNAVVKWAADQPWSTGEVILTGGSYGGMLAAQGLASRPRGLKGMVIDAAPVGYNAILMNRVPNMISGHGLPGFYSFGYDVWPASLSETPERQLRGPVSTAQHPACNAVTATAPLHKDPGSRFWQERDVASMAAGTKVPTMLMQGFNDWNVRPTAFDALWPALAGPRYALLGPWTHDGGPLVRPAYLKDQANWVERSLGHAGVPKIPTVVVSDQNGEPRTETSWPPHDAVHRPLTLNPGMYTDAPGNAGESAPPDTVVLTASESREVKIPTGRGIWTFSRPLPYDARLSGNAKLTATVSTLVPGVHLAGLVYDLDGEGNASLVARGVMEVPGSGTHTFALYPNDWHFAAGHRIGVLLAAGDDWWFEPGHTLTPVVVESGVMELPFLMRVRRPNTPTRLRPGYKPAPFPVDAATIDAATVGDPPPPPMR